VIDVIHCCSAHFWWNLLSSLSFPCFTLFCEGFVDFSSSTLDSIESEHYAVFNMMISVTWQPNFGLLAFELKANSSTVSLLLGGKMSGYTSLILTSAQYAVSNRPC